MMSVTGDCPTGILVDLDSSRDRSIQFRRSDILSLDGSSFFSPLGVSRVSFPSFHERTSRDLSYDDNEMLENEKFDFDMPSDIMEDMSPEKSCKGRDLSVKEFSEITVRPPILSPPVFDPIEEIFQEARKIARRLSLPSSSFVEDNLPQVNNELNVQNDNDEKPLTVSPMQKFNKECETEKISDEIEFCTSPPTGQNDISSDSNTAERKNTLKVNCKMLKNNNSPVTAEHLLHVNAKVRKMENIENDSRVANSSEKTSVPDSRKKRTEVVKRVQDFRKPLLGFERAQKTTNDVKQSTPHRGKPLTRSETLKEKSVTKATVECPTKDEESPRGRATVFRRRSMALTKLELTVVEATRQPRNPPSSSTTSTPGKVPESILKGLQRPALPRSITPAKVTFANQTRSTPAKESGGKTTGNADTRTAMPFPKRAAALISKIATCTPRKKTMLEDCSTPSRIRAPSTLAATPKSSSKERVQSMTPLRIAPKFNCKM